jgi:hypothetical protein
MSYPANKSPYTVLEVTVSFGDEPHALALIECPVSQEDLRRYQMELHRIGVTITVVELLNWALTATNSLDLYPAAAALMRMNYVRLPEFIMEVSTILSELGSTLQFRMGRRKTTCKVLEYCDGNLLVEVRNVYVLRAIDCIPS